MINRVGPPVRGDDCYGREDFVQLLWDKLKVGHVLLAAPRRFGKTSVMYRLIDEPAANYKIVHADLEALTEPADLITQLVLQLARDDAFSKVVGALSCFPKTLWSRFRKTFDEIELFQVKVKLREALRSRWQESGEELFKRVAESARPIIFILDEFPMLVDRMARSPEHRADAPVLLHWLRSLRQAPHFHNVHFLIAGSIGIGRILNDLGEIHSINDFEQVRLEPFPSKTAYAFLDALATAHDVTLSQPSKRKIIDLIGVPVPYFLQVLFSEVMKTQRQDHEAVTPKKIEQLYHDKVLGVDCKTYFDHYYGRLHDYYPPREEAAVKRLLRELAVSGPITRDVAYQFYREGVAEHANPEVFNRLMTDLENDFYLRFDAGERRYEFACKLLRDWWLRHYGMRTDV